MDYLIVGLVTMMCLIFGTFLWCIWIAIWRAFKCRFFPPKYPDTQKVTQEALNDLDARRN